MRTKTTSRAKGIAMHTAKMSNCQDLWIKIFYAASGSAFPPGRSMSLPLMKVAPAADQGDEMGGVDGAPAVLR